MLASEPQQKGAPSLHGAIGSSQFRIIYGCRWPRHEVGQYFAHVTDWGGIPVE